MKAITIIDVEINLFSSSPQFVLEPWRNNEENYVREERGPASGNAGIIKISRNLLIGLN